jgi:transposase-like protein
MVAKRRRYHREFMIKTVRLVFSSDHSVDEVARYLEIPPNTLYEMDSPIR